MVKRDQLRWISLAILVALLAGLRSVPLWDQDEAAYAGFAHTMLTTGDLRMPAFTWSEIHRKPPLHFWLITASFSLLGESFLALRLPGALCFVGTCLLLDRWGAPLFGAARARGGAVILGSSLALLFGKIALTDAPLLLAQTAAALALLRHLQRPALRWCVALWVAVALGLLIKGPPILILTLGMAGVLAVAHPARRALWVPLAGLPLAAVPLVAWGWWAWSVDDGQGISWMVDWYVLHRATGGTTLGHTGPPGLHLLSMLVLLFPFSALLPAALPAALRQAWQRTPWALGAVAWMAAGWWAYELIPSKLPAYALGAYPAVAVVLADRLIAQPGGWLVRAGVALAALIGLALGGGMIAGVWLAVPGAVSPGMAAPGVWLLLAGGIALWRGWQGRTPWLPLAATATGFITLAWLLALPALRPRLAVTWTVAQAALAVADSTGVTIARDYRLPSLPFYLARAGIPYRIDSAPPQAGVWITDGERPSPDATLIPGWIPDKGTPVQFWVVP